MMRRDFIALLGGAAAWPLGARAQQAALPVVGFLYGGSTETATTLVPALRKGLGETGYVEGQNVAIEYRWANNEFNRFPELAADLVRHRVAVIATQGASRRLWRPKPPRQQFRLYSASVPIRYKPVWSPVSIGLSGGLDGRRAVLTHRVIRLGGCGMKIDGGCHCGYITLEAEADPDKATICHCADCQSFSGSAFRTFARVKANTLRILSGEPTVYVKTAESGTQRAQSFCPRCGSPICATGVDEGPKTYSVRLGTIRQRDQFAPKMQIWTRSRRRWVTDLASIESVETQ